MRSLGVIIVNYRTPSMTVNCLCALAPEMSAHPHWRAIIVDNASGDDSIPRIEEAIASNKWGDWAQVLASPVNDGFAAGNNRGIAALDADAYLLLNSDTIVRPGALAILMRAMEEDAGIGLIGPRLEWPDGEPQVSCFRVRSPLGELLGAAGFSVLDRLFPKSVVRMPVSDAPIEPEWVSFACVLIRAEVIRQVGPLDDGYFMYFEDIDFARRAARAGWRIRYEPEARVVHLRGGTSPVKQTRQTRARVPRYYYESRSRYFAKWYGGRPGLWLANLLWLSGRCISWVLEVIRRREPFHCAHEGRDNWINWRDPLRTSSLAEGGQS